MEVLSQRSVSKLLLYSISISGVARNFGVFSNVPVKLFWEAENGRHLKNRGAISFGLVGNGQEGKARLQWYKEVKREYKKGLNFVLPRTSKNYRSR